jgi:hypothetical protein
MLLKSDVMTTVHQRGLMPRHAGLGTGSASDGHFFTRMICAAPDSKKKDQTRRLHVYILAEAAVDDRVAYRSGNRGRLHVKRISIQ